ncbi:hydrogenase expression/formation protein HypE [Thermofilum pendens]|uniref:Hydrogenase expression/formation protein HypE n=1 Tax=Thermofilum pendens (strain DSM 2475 / Hrk 5) TaxID=368408 RepID=A1S0M8_THEPD|nr:hydrogenase expression/formation protein HypE [Thermofilum pendens]ABL79008.1 hydrogenase expression/formation protein HypE [Thermofilum pendens Hrk 5]
MRRIPGGKGVVELADGQGGVETLRLLEELFFRRVKEHLKRVEGGVGIDFPDDGALIPLPGGGFLVVTADSYTVNPPFFPGGNIGSLAVHGSINDVVMMGGRPVAMLDTIVVEEGFPMGDLEAIVNSMLEALEKEGVPLIGGDFKVMPKGQLDRITVTTVGLGVARSPIVDKPRGGDKIVVTDYVGDHGAVILMLQMGMGDVEEIASGSLKSDSKPLTPLLPVFEKFAGYIHAARDPTRGGLAGVLNEWARSGGLLAVIREEEVPVRDAVRRFAEMLGVDPLYLASEGAAVLSVSPEVAEEVVSELRGRGFPNARVIGEFRENPKYRGFVVSETGVGGHRIIEPPRGVIVPRIC